MVHLIPGFPNKIRQLDTDSQFHIDLRMTYYQLTTNSNQQHIFINKCNFYSGTKFWFYKTVLNCSIGFTNFIVFSFIWLSSFLYLLPSPTLSIYIYLDSELWQIDPKKVHEKLVSAFLESERNRKSLATSSVYLLVMCPAKV